MNKKEVVMSAIATFVTLYVFFIIFSSSDIYCSTPPQPAFNILQLLTIAIIIFIVIGLAMTFNGIIPVPDKKK